MGEEAREAKIDALAEQVLKMFVAVGASKRDIEKVFEMVSESVRYAPISKEAKLIKSAWFLQKSL